MTAGHAARVKRVLDVAIAAIALVMFAPFMLAVALLIKLDSRGPVLFRGERIGRHGKPFFMYKFRTMVHVVKPITPDEVAAPNDPRITRIGRYLRHSKLDEMPQLINVLRGEMSLVGPRPEGFKYEPYYTSAQRHVLSVRPGITGLSQIEYADESAMLGDEQDHERVYIEQILPRKLNLDLWYIAHWSLALDVQILIRTVLRLLPGQRFDSTSPSP